MLVRAFFVQPLFDILWLLLNYVKLYVYLIEKNKRLILILPIMAY